MCKECGGHDYVYGIFENGEFDLNLELVAGVVVGAVAADKADMLLDKVDFLQKNPMVKDGAKIGLGVVLTQLGMPLATGAGYGMMAVAGTRLINGALAQAGVSGFHNPYVGGLYLNPQGPGTLPTTITGPLKRNQPGTLPTIISGSEEQQLEKMGIELNVN